MILDAKECPACGDRVFSRAGHDFRRCSCGQIFVDGGFEPYGGRVGWGTAGYPKTVKVVVFVKSQRELYIDWNTSTDRFGRLKATHTVMKAERKEG